jgi:hypothetical protein
LHNSFIAKSRSCEKFDAPHDPPDRISPLPGAQGVSPWEQARDSLRLRLDSRPAARDRLVQRIVYLRIPARNSGAVHKGEDGCFRGSADL